MSDLQPVEPVKPRRLSAHGTVARYNAGCGCDDCGEARQVYDAGRGRNKRPGPEAGTHRQRRVAVDPQWAEQAACRGEDPALFHPGKGEPVDAALAVCRRCPVVEDCLAHAVANNETRGVWGATTPNQRRHLRAVR